MDGGYSDFARLRLIRPKSPIQTGLSHFRGFALLLGILGLSAITVYSLGKQSLDSQVRYRIETELGQHFASTGHVFSLGSARFISGQGLILNDVRIALPGDIDAALVSIDEVALGSCACFGDLLLKNIEICSVNVKRAHVVVQRGADGAWNLDSLIKSLSSANIAGQRKPLPVRIQNSSIELRLVSKSQSVAYVVRDIQCIATPHQMVEGNPGGLAIRGSLAGNGVEQVSFAVDLNLANQTWSTSVAASSAQIDSHMLNIVSRSLNETAPSSCSFRGVLDVRCVANGRFTSFALDQFQVDGSLADVSFSDARFPLVVREGHAEFRVTPDSARAWNVAAKTDQGSFDLEYSQVGSPFTPNNWRVAGTGRRLSLDRRVLPLLSESLESLFKKWSPDGVFDLSFDVAGDRSGMRPTLIANLIDSSFEFEKFPYRLEHCVGRLELKDEKCSIDIQSLDGDHNFHVAGQIQNPGANYTGFVDVTSDGNIPLDAKLMRAIAAQPKMAAVVQRFHATGSLGIKARIGRESVAQEKTLQDFRVQLLNCSVRHDCFDYPLHDICGLLRIRNDRIDVDNVTAVHGNGSVRCDGIWSKSEGLKLQFLARTVSLDDQLRAALNPIARQRWSELRPRGVVDLVQVNLVQPSENAQTSVTVDAQVFAGGGQTETSVSIQPSWFPFLIHNLVGRVSIGEETIVLESLRGEHEQTWVSCNGQGRYDDRQWELRFTDLYVRGLEANDQLLAALPANIGQAIKRVHWEGLVSARGEVTISGENQPLAALPESSTPGYVNTAVPRTNLARRTPPKLAWTLRLDTDNGSFSIGFPLEHICGGTTISGIYDGTNMQCAGEIEVDSMMVGPSQINNIRGPIWIDQQHCAIGSLAQNANPDQSPRSLISEFYGGQLRIDGRMNLAEDQPFYLEANVASCDMESLSDDLIPRHKNLYGSGFASVRLSGDRSGRHSWRGDGKVQLRDARIEVPLMSAVGRSVRVSDLESTVFDESNVDFEIRGENLDLNQVEIIGRPISLIGNGKINHNREVDFDFYTILGRNRVHIPVLSELYHASSQQFLHIKVDGDLDDPQTHKTVLPGINEPLKKLLEDLEGRRPEESK